MRYFISEASSPLRYVTCGNLISKQGFLHQRRVLDTNVLILVNEGVLYLSQNGSNYAIGPKQYIFLKAGEEHFGYQPSIGKLSYYWVHFCFDYPVYAFEKSDIGTLLEGNLADSPVKNQYLIPEWGRISHTQKIMVFFHQLLDLSRHDLLYTRQMIDYALSLIVLEISQECIDLYNNKSQSFSPVVIQVMDWMKANYYTAITVAELAKEVGYNCDYLSFLFKKTTGITIISYLNKIRIENSKSLLLHYNITIKEVAYSCGFVDEKYFMKLFKKLEGMTPSDYKKAFLKKKINQT